MKIQKKIIFWGGGGGLGQGGGRVGGQRSEACVKIQRKNWGGGSGRGGGVRVVGSGWM